MRAGQEIEIPVLYSEIEKDIHKKIKKIKSNKIEGA